MTIENPLLKVLCSVVAVLCWLVIARALQKKRLDLSAWISIFAGLGVLGWIEYLAMSVSLR